MVACCLQSNFRSDWQAIPSGEKYATDVTKYKLLDADNEGQLASIDRALGSIQFSMDGTITKVNQNCLNACRLSKSQKLLANITVCL